MKPRSHVSSCAAAASTLCVRKTITSRSFDATPEVEFYNAAPRKEARQPNHHRTQRYPFELVECAAGAV